MHAHADPDSSARIEFERLYRRYAGDVYRYTLAVLRNPADAEDVTQTTFMNAYRAFARGGEPIHKPQHWLIKIAHNACRTRHLRAARRPQEVPLEDHLATLEVPAAEVPDVAEVLDALGELPFNQRAALVMRELDGRSYREIAETLGMTVAAVEALIFRARRSLRLRSSAVRALGAVQLPASLGSFSGGSLVAAGGAIAGTGLLAKTVAVVAASLLAGGVGYKAVEAKPGLPREAAEVEPQQVSGAGPTSAAASSARVSGSVRAPVSAVDARPRERGDARAVRKQRTESREAKGAFAQAPRLQPAAIARAPRPSTRTASPPAAVATSAPSASATQPPSVTPPASLPLPPPPSLPTEVEPPVQTPAVPQLPPLPPPPPLPVDPPPLPPPPPLPGLP